MIKIAHAHNLLASARKHICKSALDHTLLLRSACLVCCIDFQTLPVMYDVDNNVSLQCMLSTVCYVIGLFN